VNLRVGQGINQWVGGAFRRTFGEANSLLEIFFQNFLSSTAQTVLLSVGGLIGGFLSSILGFKDGGIITERVQWIEARKVVSIFLKTKEG